ncbi:MAG: hypothetical protein ACP5N2_01635 [Candidatus Nanoarchaeia archaeon]
MDKLSEFVKEQISRGTNVSEIKVHLLANGWSESDVNLAINNATGGKMRKNIIIAAVGILIIGILVFSLVSLAKNIKPVPAVPVTPTEVIPPAQDLTPITTSVGGCAEKESSIEKDECYKQILKTGFDCRKLTNKVELTYCNRAYEDLMIKGVERVEEN